MPLEILKAPSRRRRGLGQARHPELRLVQVFVFKAPPAPRNDTSYLSMVLDALCPEAFHSKTGIYFRTGDEGLNKEGALMFALARCYASGIKPEGDRTFYEDFTDTDGGKGMLVSVYEPR